MLSIAIVVGTGWAWQQLRTLPVRRLGRARPWPRHRAPTPAARPTPRKTSTSCCSATTPGPARPPDELRALGTQDDGGSANTDTMLMLHVPADGERRDRDLVPARLLRRHPGVRQVQAQLRLPRRLPDRGRPGRERGGPAERRHPGADLDAEQAHRPHHRPLRPGQPARLLPDQHRARRASRSASRQAVTGVELRHRPAGRAVRRSRASRRWRSSGSATASRTAAATSTASRGSSTSCRRSSGRSSRPAPC